VSNWCKTSLVKERQDIFHIHTPSKLAVKVESMLSDVDISQDGIL
jgi:hypothetical protein